MNKQINLKVMEKVQDSDIQEIITHLNKLKKFDFFVDAQFEIKH